jgi:hypothetical protein
MVSAVTFVAVSMYSNGALVVVMLKTLMADPNESTEEKLDWLSGLNRFSSDPNLLSEAAPGAY